MKCNNCSQTNTAGRLKCEYCNAPLKGSVIAPIGTNKKFGEATLKCSNCNTPNPPGQVKCQQCNALLKGSVIGQPRRRKATTKDMPTTELDNKTTPCPHCSYPNIRGTAICMKCKKNMAATPALAATPPTAETPTVKRSAPIPGGTVNPWSRPHAEEPKFRLRPLPRKGEDAPAQLEFEGGEVSLRRENLEPSNRTITSRLQAKIKRIDGTWAITDQSAQKSTFLLVRGEVKLKKGDIILMGDRMFEFDC